MRNQAYVQRVRRNTHSPSLCAAVFVDHCLRSQLRHIRGQVARAYGDPAPALSSLLHGGLCTYESVPDTDALQAAW